MIAKFYSHNVPRIGEYWYHEGSHLKIEFVIYQQNKKTKEVFATILVDKQ
jgi:hypothetical protein